MQSRAVNLANVVTATAPAVTWQGGRSVLVITASAYGTTVQLQLQNSDGTWIPYNSTTYSANGVYPLDTAAGLHRIYITGGTTTALTANLVSVPYG